MRSQRREVEGKARRAVTTLTWRNKSHNRRDLDRTIFQVKEDVPEGSAKRPTFRMKTTNKQAITFTDEDVEKVHHSHDDAIVITLLIADYTTRIVLVDNGSSADILYYPAFQQMRLGRDQLRPVNSPLVGFGGMRMQPVDTITLTVVVREYPQQITKKVNFLVVDCSSSYNAIIGRPTLNSWKAVTSTYHLSVKFPRDYGVGQV